MTRFLALSLAAGGTTEAEATGNPATFETDVAKPLKSLLVPFYPVQAGSGDPSPDNVREISGWTGVNAKHTGKSICPFIVESITKTSNFNGFSGWCDGMNVPNRTSKLTYSAYIDNTDGNDEANAKIWFKNADDSAYVDGTSVDGTKIPVGSAGWSTVVFDPSVRPNTYIIKPGLKLNNATASQPMIEFGDTRTEYEPYSGESFPVSFPDGQTIYGGSLDLVSGVLTVTHIGRTAKLSDRNDTSVNGDNTFYGFTAFFKYPVKNDYKQICSIARYAWNAFDKTFPHFYAYTLTQTQKARLMMYVPTSVDPDTEFTCVAELETPQTVQLDPVTIQTLIGNNTVWTDTNGTNTVVYLKKA